MPTHYQCLILFLLKFFGFFFRFFFINILYFPFMFHRELNIVDMENGSFFSSLFTHNARISTNNSKSIHSQKDRTVQTTTKKNIILHDLFHECCSRIISSLHIIEQATKNGFCLYTVDYNCTACHTPKTQLNWNIFCLFSIHLFNFF